MGLFVNTNSTSMASQRHLAQNTKSLQSSFERLSSGLRINSAADDAAGMNIATKMTAQVKGLNQAARNVNDTSSMLKTAESALGETNNLLQRMRELAVQAGNDTNTAADRTALQSEVTQILGEINRIGDQVQFNDQTLLDGTFSEKSFQIGANSGQTVEVSLNSAKTTALGQQATSDGNIGAADNSGIGAVGNNTTSAVLAAGDYTIEGIGAAVEVGASAADGVSFSNSDQSATAKANAINAVTAKTGVSATAVAGTFTGDATITGTTTDAMVDNGLKINGVGITFAGGSLIVSASDGDGKLQSAINAKTASHGVSASVSSGNKLVLTAVDGRNITVEANTFGINNTGATTANGVSQNSYGSLQLTSSSDFTVARKNAADMKSLGFSDADSVAASVDVNVDLDTISLTSATEAATAVTRLDLAIAQVASSRSDIGAVLNRLDSAANTLASSSENMSAARSQVQDVDFASETAAFSKSQILQQASSAMLAQANVSGQIALSLLGFG